MYLQKQHYCIHTHMYAHMSIFMPMHINPPKLLVLITLYLLTFPFASHVRSYGLSYSCECYHHFFLQIIRLSFDSVLDTMPSYMTDVWKLLSSASIFPTINRSLNFYFGNLTLSESKYYINFKTYLHSVIQRVLY